MGKLNVQEVKKIIEEKGLSIETLESVNPCLIKNDYLSRKWANAYNNLYDLMEIIERLEKKDNKKD